MNFRKPLHTEIAATMRNLGTNELPVRVATSAVSALLIEAHLSTNLSHHRQKPLAMPPVVIIAMPSWRSSEIAKWLLDCTRLFRNADPLPLHYMSPQPGPHLPSLHRRSASAGPVVLSSSYCL